MEASLAQRAAALSPSARHIADEMAQFFEALVDLLMKRSTSCHGASVWDDGLKVPGSMVQFGQRLGLGERELELVALALAPHYSHDVACLYGVMAQLEGASGACRDVLAAAYGLAPMAFDLRFGSLVCQSSRLVRSGLLVRVKGMLSPSRVLCDLLGGRATLPSEMLAYATHLKVPSREPVLNPDVADQFEQLRAIWSASAIQPLTLLQGVSGAGRTLLACHLAGAVGMDLLKVDLDAVPEHVDVLALEREALALGAVLLCKTRLEALGSRWLSALAELSQGAVPLVLAVESQPADLVVPHARSFARLEVTSPNTETRMRLWARYLPVRLRVGGLTDERLAFRFRGMNGADIADLSRLALEQAQMCRLAQGKRAGVGMAALVGLNHTLQTGRLSGLGHFVAPLEGGLSRVVLSERQAFKLREVIDRSVFRQQVLSQWGFESHGAAMGHVVLLSGPPGTGKTLSARAAASELGVPLYQVDLSRLVDKYIGETEKNLAAVFDDAERSGAALLFDEADALFARRSEVSSSNDRHANLEVGYLLQRIEAFAGLCFLTTNLPSSIDPAFERRIAIHIRYELPGKAERERIWRACVPAQAPLDDGIDWSKLAKGFDQISGGDIRNAVLRAAFIAARAGAPIDQQMFSHAMGLEMVSRGNLVRVCPRDPSWDRVLEGA